MMDRDGDDGQETKRATMQRFKQATSDTSHTEEHDVAPNVAASIALFLRIAETSLYVIFVSSYVVWIRYIKSTRALYSNSMADAARNEAAAATLAAKEEYMQTFSRLFEAELLEVYDADVNGEAVKHLRSCIEAGVAVWGHPLVLRDPIV